MTPSEAHLFLDDAAQRYGEPISVHDRSSGFQECELCVGGMILENAIAEGRFTREAVIDMLERIPGEWFAPTASGDWHFPGTGLLAAGLLLLNPGIPCDAARWWASVIVEENDNELFDEAWESAEKVLSLDSSDDAQYL